MIVWLLLICFLVELKIIIDVLNVKDMNKIYLIFASIAIIFLMGARSTNYPRVNDVSVYVYFYKLTRRLSWKFLLSKEIYNFELGFVFLNKIVSTVFPFPQALFFAEAIIVISCLSYFIYKNSSEPMDSLIFFMSFGLLRFSLTGIRQSIAMSICLLSIEFIKKKRLLPFIIIVLFAMLFHKSAFVFFIVYPIINKRINYKHILGMLFIMIILFLVSDKLIYVANVFLGRDYYTGLTEDGIGNILIHIFTIIMFILFRRQNEETTIGFNMSILSFYCYILSYFVLGTLQRISWYFYFGIIITIPNLYPIHDMKKRLVVRILFILISVFLMYHRFKDGIYDDYEFFWQ